MATESVPYSGEMLRGITKLVEHAQLTPQDGNGAQQLPGSRILHSLTGSPQNTERPIRPKLVERIMPVVYEERVDLFQEFFAFDNTLGTLAQLMGVMASHLDRATVRHCMELVRWGNRLRLADALIDAYSRKCQGEYCLGNDSTRAEPCNQAIEASTDPEVVLCKKCREEA